MACVGVVYFSGIGATHALAESVCEGVESQGVTAVSHRIVMHDIADMKFVNCAVLDTLDDCDALVFGSPTYMGGPAAQFKAFADASSDRWEAQRWCNKIAAGFTCGANPSGDQLATLQCFSLLAAQHGMLWIGLDAVCADHSEQQAERDRFGTQLGASAMADESGLIDTVDANTAYYLGARVAQAATRWSRSD